MRERRGLKSGFPNRARYRNNTDGMGIIQKIAAAKSIFRIRIQIYSKGDTTKNAIERRAYSDLLAGSCTVYSFQAMHSDFASFTALAVRSKSFIQIATTVSSVHISPTNDVREISAWISA